MSKQKEFKKYGTDPELDKMVDSVDDHVREAVARQGYGLEKLINDEDWRVRAVVAYHGYGLDKLINVKENDIWWTVKTYLNINNYSSLQDWIDQNPDKCALPENRKQATQKEFKPKGLNLLNQAKSQPNPGKDQR